MPLVKIDVYPKYRDMYKNARYPLGKSRKGFKKWIKRRIIQSLRYWMNKDNESNK